MKTLYSIVGCCMLSSAFGMSAEVQVEAPNGDFEAVRQGEFLYWQARGDVEPSTRFQWHRELLKFNTGEYRRLRLYVRLQDGTGTVRFDEIASEGLTLRNGGFEHGRENKIDGWGQDDVGKTVFLDERVKAAGKRSLRITRTKPGTSRAWVDIRCEPNRTYSIRGLMRVENVTVGRAYMEVYGIHDDGTHGAILSMGRFLTGSTLSAHGRYVCALRNGGSVWQQVTLPANRNIEVSVEINAAELARGTLRLTLADSAENRVLGQAKFSRAKIAPVRAAWEALAARFPCRPEAAGRRVELRLTLDDAEGIAYCDNVSIRSPRIAPQPKRVTWRGAEENFRLTSDVVLVVSDSAQGRELTGPRLLQDELERRAGFRPPVVKFSQWRPGGRAILIGEPDEHPGVRSALQRRGLQLPRESEGYLLDVSRGRVLVAGLEPRGAFYATMTLMEMFVDSGEGIAEIAAARIVDWPELPLRGTYGLKGDVASAARYFARLKLNAVLIESGEFYQMHKPEVRGKWQRLFKTLRDHFLEPIPEIQSFGHAHAVLGQNPNCAEAKWVQDEPYVLKGEQFVEVKHRNIIETPSSHLTATSADKRTVYVEGKAYRLERGELRLRYRGKLKPWRIARIATGRIPDGAKVLLSYDYVPVERAPFPHDWGRSYCPNEPLVYEIMKSAIQNTVRYLRPRYLHIGHDEIGMMNADSRCRKAGKTNAENLAADIAKLRASAREVDPRIELMMWADMLNPYHLGKVHKQDPTLGAVDLLPKDVIMCVWFYSAGQPQNVGWKSIEFFARKGFRTTGSPWYDKQCAREWSEVCSRARKQGLNCLGVIYTSWSGRWDALEECASSAWRGPDKP
ncbi:MAG: glycoside hydrolase family 20 zincin-like fold domain-containing protein [Alphaproteobacteria bacterium]